MNTPTIAHRLVKILLLGMLLLPASFASAHVAADRTYQPTNTSAAQTVEDNCLLLVDQDYLRIMNNGASKSKASHLPAENLRSVINNTGRVYRFRLATLVAPEYLDEWFPQYEGHTSEHKEEITKAIKEWWTLLENKLNKLYREPVGIEFKIVRDERLILFSYADVNNEALSAYGMLECRPFIEKRIGSNDAYDLGIVIGNPRGGRAGVAALGSAVGPGKGSAVAMNIPTTIAHEIGHCFGAAHTHQKGDANCTEPGSGTSVMSYGAPRDFFALSSIVQMRNVIANMNYYTDEAHEHLVKVQDDPTVNSTYAYEEQGQAPQLDRNRMKYEYVVTTGTNFQFSIPVITQGSNDYYYSVNPFDISLYDPQHSNALKPAYKETTGNVVQFEPVYVDPVNVKGNVTTEPFSGDSRTGIYTFLGAVRNHSRYDSRPIRLRIVEGEPFKITEVKVEGNRYNKSIGRTCTLNWNPCTELYGKNSRVRISLSDDFGKTYQYVLADDAPNNGSCTVTLPYIKIGTGKYHNWSIEENGGRFKVEVIGEAAYAIYPEEAYTYNQTTPSLSVSNGFTLNPEEQQYAFRTLDGSDLPPLTQNVEKREDIPAPTTLEAFRNKNHNTVYPVSNVKDVVMGSIVQRRYEADCGGTVYTYTQTFRLPETPSEHEQLNMQAEYLEPMAHELHKNIGKLGYPKAELQQSKDFMATYSKVFDESGLMTSAVAGDLTLLQTQLTALTELADQDIVMPEDGHTYMVRFYLSPYGRDKYYYLAEDNATGQYFTPDSAKATKWKCTAKDGIYHFMGEQGHEMFTEYTPQGQTEHNIVFDSFTNVGHAFSLQRGYSWGAYSIINSAGYGCQISVEGRFSIVRGPNNIPMTPDQRCNCNDGLNISTDFQLIDITPTDPTGIQTATNVGDDAKNNMIYSLDGRSMGRSINRLPKGIYIYKGKKYIKP